MTFEQWWRENEAKLAQEHYQDGAWTGIYQMLREAFEAGQEQAP